jgi:DNA invertase Pin-like site-specific DNA recombinase
LVKEGLQKARARGAVLGRPEKATKIAAQAVDLFNAGYKSEEIAVKLKTSRTTVYRALQIGGVDFEKRKGR